MNIDMSKIYSRILKIIYHYSTALTSWSWHKLYGDRKKGYGYKKEKFDGRSRPSNDTYRKRFDEIFKPKTLHEELMEGFKKEQEDLKDEEEQ